MLIVAAAIVDSLENPIRLLAAERSAPEALAGMWEFPGGKVEPDEDPEAALLREIREELGVELELGEILSGPDGDWPLPNGRPMRLWLAIVTEGEPQPLQDHSELRWLTADSLNSVPWLEGDLPIIEQIEREGLLN